MSDNPYESPEESKQVPTGSSLPAKSRNIVSYFIVGIMLAGLLIALLLPSVRGSREAARRNTCSANLKQIMLALHTYRDAHGTLPPAYTVDADGNRLHSWRTLILPYIEGNRLYESIDFSKAWDDPANAHAHEETMSVYLCPSATHEDKLTTYFAVVGPECVFFGPVPRKLSEVTDGVRNTIAIIDAPSDRAIHWMSPHDISPDDLIKFLPDADTSHPGIVTAVFLDGSVHAFPQDIEPDDLRVMLTIAGGEPMPELFD